MALRGTFWQCRVTGPWMLLGGVARGSGQQCGCPHGAGCVGPPVTGARVIVTTRRQHLTTRDSINSRDR